MIMNIYRDIRLSFINIIVICLLFHQDYAIKCFEKYKLANPDKEIPSNMGSKLTTIEEQSLLDNLKNNLDIEDIAKKHSRTTCINCPRC